MEENFENEILLSDYGLEENFKNEIFLNDYGFGTFSRKSMDDLTKFLDTGILLFITNYFS